MNALLSLWLAAAAASPPSPSPAPAVRRFALLVATHDGGPGRVPLRYAASDARALGRVLEELGGVAPADRVMLAEAGREDFLEGVRAFGERLAQARGSGARVEALVYYSGHSDEEGLLLKGQRLDYPELRRAVEALPADVRIAILDSCSSGALARRKGGSRRPAFLVDASTTVRGQAILTSSSADEASQESDRIKGSFFTHNLVSALRGAGDVTGDGRVTLNEAYQFAFHETLARTERTQAGAQHPAYDIELAGAGDLVMTDVRSTSAGLVLAPELDGRLYVRDGSGALVVELNKAPGRAAELGLAPGTYSVVRDAHGTTSRAQLELREGERTPLQLASFSGVARERTALRGGTEEPHRQQHVDVSLLPGLSTNATGGYPVDNRLSISLLGGRSTRLDGAALSLGVNWTEEDTRGIQVGVVGNVTGGPLLGGQVSTAFNWAGAGVGGVQVTSGFNWAEGPVRWGQFSAAFNVAQGDVDGIQGTAGFNVARAVRGTQASAGFNVALGSVEGVQATAGLNVARGDVRGAQASAGFNWATGVVTGAQTSAGFNYARGLDGAQVAVLNIGGDVKGAQVGILNIASRVRGAQVGILNIASHVDGESVGMLSIVGNGRYQLEAYGSDVTAGNLALKLGTRHVYSVLAVGYGRADGEDHSTAGIGLGVHLPRGPLTLDVDLVSHAVDSQRGGFDPDVWLYQARAIGAYSFAPHFAVMAGPTFNVAVEDGLEAVPRKLSFLGDSTRGHTRRWFGFVAGVRI